MTYGDKTWCAAICKADGACGRILTDWDNTVIREKKLLVSYADFSKVCELFVPDEDGGSDAKEG